MPSAPVAVSSQSRKRLKQFQFTENSPETEADQENSGSRLSLQDSLGDAHDILPQPQAGAIPKQQSSCPYTPASKIPLAALIGDTEDAFNGANFDTTPEDHVSWQHGPRSSDAASSLRSTQRGKKRARSSSPAPYSQIEKSHHLSAQTEPLDLQNLKQSLKTPQHDPATDLWARYSTASLAKANGDSAALPLFAQLISSSPQTPNTTNSKDGGLQRSTSCGIEWPTSKKKRRKLDAVEGCGRRGNIFEPSKQDHSSAQEPGPSRVDLLVGKIKDSMLRKPSTLARRPSSSSPLPGRADVAIPQPASPSPQKRAQHDLPASKLRQVQELDVLGASQSNENPIAEDGSSSEFGDGDLDLNFLETIEMTAPQMMSEKGAVNGETQINSLALDGTITAGTGTDQLGPEKHTLSPPQSNITHTLQRASPTLMVATEQESDDEFAIDDTAFATEMQGLAERYDTQDTTFSGFANGPQADQVHHLYSAIDSNMQRTDANDGYENDFDDDDDLWDEIGSQNFSPQRVAGVGSSSQVRAFH